MGCIQPYNMWRDSWDVVTQKLPQKKQSYCKNLLHHYHTLLCSIVLTAQVKSHSALILLIPVIETFVIFALNDMK